MYLQRGISRVTVDNRLGINPHIDSENWTTTKKKKKKNSQFIITLN